MTPERRAKIDEVLKHQDGLDGEYLDLVMTDNDTLAAENERLNREVERLKNDGFCHCPVDLMKTVLEGRCGECGNPIADLIYDGYTRMKESNATLRRKLDALVKAGEEVVRQHGKTHMRCETMHQTKMADELDECVDALSSALAEAKEGKE